MEFIIILLDNWKYMVVGINNNKKILKVIVVKFKKVK